MATRKIITSGDELLSKKAKDVSEVTDRTRGLLDDMWDTVREHNGVGLAAPQIGVLRKALIVNLESYDDKNTAGGDEAEPPESKNFKLEIINPEILSSEGEQMSAEGCLSVPDLTYETERPKSMTVRGLNRDGERIEVTAEGYSAIVLSHEMDHLNGILISDIGTLLSEKDSK
jgi:peptide deformylase